MTTILLWVYFTTNMELHKDKYTLYMVTVGGRVGYNIHIRR